MKRTLLILMMISALLLCAACGSEPAAEPVESSSEESLPESVPESALPESSSGEASASEEAPEVSAESESPSEAAPAPESAPQPEPAPAPESQSEAAPESQSEPAPQPEPEPAVPAGPPPYLGVGAPAVPRGGDYLGDVESAVLTGINDERSYAGAAPVAWDENLADAARIRASELAGVLMRTGEMQHNRPNGDRWITVLQSDVPVNYSAAGEILAGIKTQQNYDKIESSDYWVNQWVNSSSHYACMTKGEYTHVGVGVVEVYDEDEDMYYGLACSIFARW